MEPVKVDLRRRVSVLDRADVDTDQIIPKQFLKRVERTGFGEFLFYDWAQGARLGPARRTRSSPPARTSAAARRREHAPWALQDYGFQAVVAASLRRHLLQQLHEDRPAAGRAARGRRARADGRPARARSTSRRSRCASTAAPCRSSSTPRRRRRLLDGLDDIAIALEHDDEIVETRSASANVQVRYAEDLITRVHLRRAPDRDLRQAAADRPAQRDRQPGDGAADPARVARQRDRPRPRADSRPQGVDEGPHGRRPRALRRGRRARQSRTACATSRASARTTSTPSVPPARARRTSSRA